MADVSYDDCARAVGGVVNAWNGVEYALDDLLASLADYVGASQDNPRVRAVQTVIIDHLDQRGKVAAAKVLAFSAHRPQPFYDNLEALLNKVDNELRTKRNRFAHDYWIPYGEEAIRIQRGHRIIRPQSRQLQHEPVRSFAYTLSEMTSLEDELHKVAVALVAMAESLDKP